MNKTLHVAVVNKIATYHKRGGAIVCGNSDYQVKFTFDSEWDAHATKTARFIWNGQYCDVIFTGDTCPVPIIKNTESLEVGVYAGNLTTTTPAIIGCRLSILCEGEPVQDEPSNGEAQADVVREAGVQALSDIAEAKSEMLNEIELAAEIVQTTGGSKTAVMSQAATSEKVALLNEKLNKRPGKNLFDKNAVTSGFFITSNGNLQANAGYVVSDYIPVEPQTDYTLTILHGGGALNAFYDKYLVCISVVSQAELISNNGTFTTPENCAFIRVSETVNRYASQQIEKGNEKTAFEEYTEYVPLRDLKEFCEENAQTTKEFCEEIIYPIQKTYLKKIVGKNLFDKNAVTNGYFLNDVGTMYSNTDYAVSDFIPVDPSASYAITGLIGGGAKHCFYNELKKVVGYIADGELLNTYGGILTVPADTHYVRFSIDVRQLAKGFQVERGTKKTPFEEYTEYVPLRDVEKEVSALKAQISKTAKNPTLSATAPTLNDGEYLNLANNIDVKKNCTQAFFAKITNFNSVQVGHGETEFSGYYAVIDNANITVYKWNGDMQKQEAHGLTIADYIYVVINKYDERNVNIIVSTSTGSYTLSAVSWGGDNGAIHAKSIGSALTDCVLNWACSDLKCDIWVFGDSYLGLDYIERFPYHLLQYGYKNWLACGASGASSAKEYDAFTKLLELGTPKYAVWCLGMNNPDSGSINASYLTNTQAFIAKCEENGIVPIISTIPSCWGSTADDSDITITRDNSYKTAWVRASGHRYIDFADAVEQEGGGWYDGMLSTDGVHPTTLGAVTLANRFILDFPEICTTA